MNATLIYYTHFTIGMIIALYAILVFTLDMLSKAHDLDSETFKTLNERLFWTVWIGNFIVLAALLTGGYLGTPYFKLKSTWIFGKVLGYLFLAGIMGMMGTRLLKKRRNALAANDLQQAGHLSNHIHRFAYLQLIGVLLVIGFAFSRRIFPKLILPLF
ncbi:MAG: hypothetical protein D6675_13475 [Gemmatimonadetes bacterium]|nr:MAG: hypothetical protein D6675_13475 [Gemmatimonadota bacterium]